MAVIQSILLAVAALGQQANASSYQPEPPAPAEFCRHGPEGSTNVWLSALVVDGMQLAGREGLASLGRRGRVVVDGGNFRNADLSGLRLRDICFVDADFAGSDWSRVRAEGVVLAGGSLADANLADSDLRGIVLSNLALDNVDAGGARLAFGRIVGGPYLTLEGLRLEQADLSSFVFECGITVFDSCPAADPLNLRGADLTDTQLQDYWGPIDTAGARVNGTGVGLHQLRELAGANLRGPVVVRGGDAATHLSPDEYRRVAAAVRDRVEDEAGFVPGQPPSWLRPGQIALFIDSATAFDPAFQDDPLFRRLVPVIVGSAVGRVVVTVRADGSIDAVGDAVGGNAHLCSLGGEALRLDPATGWFSGPYTPTGDEPAEWRSRPMPVLRFWQDKAEVYQHGHGGFGDDGDPRFSEYAGCGARAGFDTLLRLPVTDTEAREIADTLRDANG